MLDSLVQEVDHERFRQDCEPCVQHVVSRSPVYSRDPEAAALTRAVPGQEGVVLVKQFRRKERATGGRKSDGRTACTERAEQASGKLSQKRYDRQHL
jgi:hypothetical protein